MRTLLLTLATIVLLTSPAFPGDYGPYMEPFRHCAYKAAARTADGNAAVEVARRKCDSFARAGARHFVKTEPCPEGLTHRQCVDISYRALYRALRSGMDKRR